MRSKTVYTVVMNHKDPQLTVAMIGQKGLPIVADAGGIERHVEELGARLAKLGMRVLIYSRPRYTTTDEEVIRGMTVVRTWAAQTKSLDALTGTLSATIDAIIRKVDVFHYHGVGPATLAWLPRIFAPHARIIVTFHSVDRFHGKWGPFARAYLRFGEWASCRFPHATIAVSRTIAEYCERAYGRKATYIPNGASIPSHPGHDLLAQWGILPGRYVLTVARLVRQKGVHHLLKAFDGFEKDIALVIAGAPSFGEGYADELRRTSEGNSSIVFVGFQTGRALAQLYANAYAYVHPSDAEGMPIAVLEAMAAGRCVLVSDIPEHIDPVGENGITFVRADAADLRVKLQQLLNHPEIVQRLGDRAKEWVRTHYDWDTIATQTADVYRDRHTTRQD